MPQVEDDIVNSMSSKIGQWVEGSCGCSTSKRVPHHLQRAIWHIDRAWELSKQWWNPA